MGAWAGAGAEVDVGTTTAWIETATESGYAGERLYVIAAAGASASAGFNVTTIANWGFGFGGSFEPGGGAFYPGSGQGLGRTVEFVGVFATGSNSFAEVAYQITTDLGIERSANLTYDSVNDEYVFDVDNTDGVAGTYDVQKLHHAFTDFDMDVNADGRFTQEDVDVAGANTTTTNMALYGGYDYDSDGTLDQSDVDIAQFLIDGGMSAHIFGDVTGDGVADCDDRATYASHTYGSTVVMGTAGYRVEFDFELDGDNDSADEAQLDVIFALKADMNGDGILDNGDISTFTALFLAGDLAADMNGDGILDNGDISTFMALFLAGC